MYGISLTVMLSRAYICHLDIPAMPGRTGSLFPDPAVAGFMRMLMSMYYPCRLDGAVPRTFYKWFINKDKEMAVNRRLDGLSGRFSVEGRRGGNRGCHA
jgi:hypothetical protein